jgi:DNA-binding LacI/PurR family transcriptional regulator
MSSPAPVTMQEIADRARACKSTVSLALRNSRKISPARRAEIQTIAAEMGYRPNPLISAHMAFLRTLSPVKAHGNSIAFVSHCDLSDLEKDTLTPLQLYYTGARERAHEMGYQLELFNLFGPGMTGRRLSQILVARGITGVIIGPLSDGIGLADVTLDWDAFSLAMIEHTFVRPRLHKVCNDEFSTIGRLIQRLLDSGFARIGIAMASHMDEHANHYWLAGYQTFQALTDSKHRMPHFITPGWTRERFLQWHRRWRPEAIITIGSDVVRWLREDGVRVPEDVSCASVYWQKKRAYLSGYYQNHELMGAAAVDLVAEQLNRNERGLPHSEKTTLIQAEWKEGSTVRSNNADAAAEPLLVWKR